MQICLLVHISALVRLCKYLNMVFCPEVVPMLLIYGAWLVEWCIYIEILLSKAGPYLRQLHIFLYFYFCQNEK